MGSQRILQGTAPNARLAGGERSLPPCTASYLPHVLAFKGILIMRAALTKSCPAARLSSGYPCSLSRCFCCRCMQWMHCCQPATHSHTQRYTEYACRTHRKPPSSTAWG
eukprot:655531-Pelagomonas_calceolata.AAC.16